MSERGVIVTGGFGTLGAAVAKAFAKAGDRVALLDQMQKPNEALKAALPGALFIGGVNLSDTLAAKDAVGQVVKAFGRLDVVVNVAGTFRWETVEAGSLETWDLLYTVNLKTAVAVSKAALETLGKSGTGRIVNIGANAASRAAAGMGAYTASKSGVARLTEALAEELKGRKITVNAILPTTIDTPANRADMPDADFKTWVQPEAIAEVILFLASPAGGAVNGALLPVAGGG